MLSLRGPLCAGGALSSGGSCGGLRRARDVGPRFGFVAPYRLLPSTPHIAAAQAVQRELEQLKSLRDRGLIDEAEYKVGKGAVLAKHYGHA